MNNSKILPRRDANAADFKVNKYTRAGQYGKAICCPECKDVMTVYHFAWSRLECLNCKQSVDKYDWRVIPTQGQLGLIVITIGGKINDSNVYTTW